MHGATRDLLATQDAQMRGALFTFVPLLVELGVRRAVRHLDARFPGERVFVWRVFCETCNEFAHAFHCPLEAPE